jgi:hypothetical protein
MDDKKLLLMHSPVLNDVSQANRKAIKSVKPIFGSGWFAKKVIIYLHIWITSCIPFPP